MKLTLTKKRIHQAVFNLIEKQGTRRVANKSRELALSLFIKHNITNIVIRPYASLDCKILHRGLAEQLRHSGAKVEEFTQSLSLVPGDLSSVGCSSGASPGSSIKHFQETLKNRLQELEIEEFYYPVLDTVIRQVPFDFLKNLFIARESFYKKILELVKQSEETALQHDAAIIADSAYAVNGIIKTSFLQKGKRVFYLNPRGQFMEFRSVNVSEMSAVLETESISPGHHDSIERYITKRFKGTMKSDMDSSRAFNKQRGRIRNLSLVKNILYLHAFRDANNNSWSPDQIFDSYLEWAEKTIRTISHLKAWEFWWIKAHPSAVYYDSDRELLNELLKSFEVPSSVVDSCPSSVEILQHQCPVFSNQGSVVLETLVHGYRSIFCGSRFSSDFGFKVTTIDEWKGFVSMQPEHLQKICSNVPVHFQNLAKRVLWESFGNRNIKSLCPSSAVTPASSVSQKFWAGVSQIKNASGSDPTIATDVPIVGEYSKR